MRRLPPIIAARALSRVLYGARRMISQSSAATGFAIAIEDEPAEADWQAIEQALVVFNERAAQPYDRRPIGIFLRDGEGKLVGGITGWTNWGWIYLDCFFLPEEVRKTGWGTQLLAAAEAAALKRGCTRACLYTYSFQALPFYQRHGYEVFGTLEDYPPGHRQHWLRKTLSPSPARGGGNQA
jgi:GNAT superfamily N-acetyltransferase